MTIYLFSCISLKGQKEINIEEEEKSYKNYNTKLKTLLIIEESIDIRTQYYNSFGHEYNILFAKDGSEAIQHNNSNREIDLIIADTNSSDMKGESCVKKILENEPKRIIPVIFTTSNPETNNIFDYLSLGAIDYIKKPFSMIELTLKVKSILLLIENYRILLMDSVEQHIDDFLSQKLHDDNKHYKSNRFDLNNKKIKHFLITKKEEEIIYEISQGLSYKEIAYKLNISINTVSSHIHRIYKKCSVNNSASLLKLFC